MTYWSELRVSIISVLFCGASLHTFGTGLSELNTVIVVSTILV